MGKKAPAAPNPYAVANAQSQVNADTARTQAALNRGNTFTPFGSVTSRDLGADWAKTVTDAGYQAYLRGEVQPASGQWDWNTEYQAARNSAGNPYRDQWETRMTLSPEQQQLYEQGVQLDRAGGQMALDMLPEARRALAQPLAMDDADARDRATAGIMSRLEPQFERDRAALESRLVAQGFTPGSEGYARAADELSRMRTDARMQAVTAGLAESRNAANFNNALRGQRINELGMLFGLGPGMQGPQQAQLSPVQLQAPDLASMIYSNYNAQNQNYMANNANWFGLGGALLGAGGAALGGYLRRP